MVARVQREGTVRWLGIDELCAYLTIGKHSALKIGEESGSKRHYGRRVFYDRLIIDKYLDSLTD